MKIQDIDLVVNNCKIHIQKGKKWTEGILKTEQVFLNFGRDTALEQWFPNWSCGTIHWDEIRKCYKF